MAQVDTGGQRHADAAVEPRCAEPASMPAHAGGAMARAAPPLVFPATAGARRAAAVLDAVESARCWRYWMTLPLMALARSYRRSGLGPFWEALARGIVVVGLGVVFGKLLDTQASRYLPHLVLGMLIWRFLRVVVSRGVRVFYAARWCVAHGSMPLCVHVYRRVWSALLDFAHYAALVCAAGMAFGLVPGPEALLALAGVALLCLNGVSVGVVVGVASIGREALARRLLIRAMRMAYVATPILWMPHFLPNRPVIVDANPLYHLIETVRGPLLGNPPSALSWLVAAGVTAVGLAVALETLARCRGRIGLWV